jgi:hypothetical protein
MQQHALPPASCTADAQHVLYKQEISHPSAYEVTCMFRFSQSLSAIQHHADWQVPVLLLPPILQVHSCVH